MNAPLHGENNFTIVPPVLESKQNKMNTTEVKGNWNEQKGKLKKKFGYLTDNDLMFEEGMQEVMYGKLQIKLGKTKDEFIKLIASL